MNCLSVGQQIKGESVHSDILFYEFEPQCSVQSSNSREELLSTWYTEDLWLTAAFCASPSRRMSAEPTGTERLCIVKLHVAWGVCNDAFAYWMLCNIKLDVGSSKGLFNVFPQEMFQRQLKAPSLILLVIWSTKWADSMCIT